MGKILYITWDGILEPLGESQVFSYLVEMRAIRPELSLFLLSYEKPEDLKDTARFERLALKMRTAGIHWVCLGYHRRLRLLASAFDVLRGLLISSFLIVKHRVRIVHTRSFMAALLGCFLQTVFRCQWLFDIRGFWSDEKVDGGMWSRSSWRYRICRRLEKFMRRRANKIVTLTEASLRYLPSEKTTIIPTCVQLNTFRRKTPTAEPICFGYLGSTVFSYDFEPALSAFKRIADILPEAGFLFLSRDGRASIAERLKRENILERSQVKQVAFSEVPNELEKIHGALFFIKPTFSKIASCPTKLGELLAMGIPVMTNSGVGDVEKLLALKNVGVCIPDFTERAVREGVKRFLDLVSDPDVGRRCRETAEVHFSLSKGAADYLKVYDTLLS